MTYLEREQVEQNLPRIKKLHAIAQERGQSLAQMAVAWLLKDPRVTSVLVGASSAQQLEENVASLEKRDFSDAELNAIEKILQV
jgi:L-glyceraldehyde 3-phosphate reductase